MLAYLKHILKENNCESSVLFVPRIPLTELPAYYRSADISVVPSLYDNSPYTCLEAMSCGKAVIGTSAGGTREYIVDGDSGVIVPPRDSEALANALVKLLQDKPYRDFLSKNARERVLNSFQRKKIAADTALLYEQAIQRFKINHKSLYLRPAEQAVPDAAVMLYALDRMIYNLMFQESYRFRLSYWMHHMMHRPKLFSAKAMLALVRPLSKLLHPRGDRVLGIQTWLEQQVKARQEDPFAKVLEFAKPRRELVHK